MELQWPLIIFTTFIAWASGVVGAQSIIALKDGDRKVQLPALITAAVILVVGGIAVFFHLQHWERIFNGFGNPTSGITQELVMIVALAVVMVVYFAMLRRHENQVPKALAVIAVVVSVALCAVMAHSYMMPSRPVWDSVLWIAFVVGNACVLGPATLAVISFIVNKKETGETYGLPMIAGAIVNAVTTVAYAASMTTTGSAFVDMGYSFDPTMPNKPLPDMSSAINVFTGDYALLMWVGVIVVGAIVPLVAAFVAKKKPAMVAMPAIIVVAGIAGAICMRVVFYLLGANMFLLF